MTGERYPGGDASSWREEVLRRAEGAGDAARTTLLEARTPHRPRVALRSDLVDHDLVTSYVRPWVEAVAAADGGEAAWEVRLATLRADAWPGPDGPAPVPDGRTDAYPAIDSVVRAFRLGDADVLFQWSEGRPYQALRVRRRRVAVLAPDDRETSHFVAIRILRILLVLEELRAGAVHVHASAVVRDGGAYLFVADKFGGKTTTMLGFLRDYGCGFLSNDQVLISPADGAVSGIPLAIGVRPNTLRLFPELLRHAEAGELGHPLREREDKLIFSPGDLAAALGAPRVPHAELRAIVYLELDLHRRSLRVTPLGHDRAETVLRSMLLPEIHKKQPFWDAMLDRREDELREAVARIVRRTPVFEAHYNHKVLADLAAALF